MKNKIDFDDLKNFGIEDIELFFETFYYILEKQKKSIFLFF